MCEPVSITLGVTAAVGAVTAAVGAGIQGAENDRATKAQDVELERAARMERANAVAAEAHGSILAGRARSRGTAVREAARVAYSQSGVDATTGTPTQLDAATVAAAELDAEAARVEAAQRAFGHREARRRYGVMRAEGMARNAAAQAGLGVATAGSVTGSLLQAGGQFFKAAKSGGGGDSGGGGSGSGG